MPFEIPVGPWMEALVAWLREHAAGLFDGVAALVDAVVGGLEYALLSIQPWAGALVVVAVSFLRLGLRGGLGAAAGMLLILGMDAWDATVETLALVLSAALFSLAVGLPVGVLSSRSDATWSVVRPVLDFMQTMPPFVYLIPAILFFGVGEVPGTIATIIFAMPPAVRLTNLGIRQVPRETVEAGLAFGCTPGQLLFKVQLPVARPSIMAGVNQTIMLALSMVVIASMIGAGGLGKEVLVGIQRLDIGLGFEAGFGVVIIAILLDRLTQSFTGGQPTLRERLRSLAFWRDPPAAAADAGDAPGATS